MMNYKKIYDSLIIKRLTHKLLNTDEGEIHHIQPKSIRPDLKFDKTNLVKLTYREHFIAHKLLFKMYLNTEYESQMANAFWRMCYCQKDQIYNINKTSRSFAYEKQQAMLAISKSLKGRIRINNGRNQKMITKDQLFDYMSDGWQIGGLPLSKKHKQKLSEIGKQHKHQPLSDKTRSKISKALKNRKLPAEVCEKMSKSRKGRISPMKGKHQSEEAKQKIGLASKGNHVNSGKISVTKDFKTFIMVFPDQIPQGYVRGAKRGYKLSARKSKSSQ